MNKEQLNEIELEQKLEKTENISDVVSVLKDYGMEITEEELLERLDDSTDELSDMDLEEVSGGSVFTLMRLTKWTILWLKKNRKHFIRGGGYAIGGGGGGSFGGGGYMGGGSR